MEEKYGYQAEDFERKPAAERVRILDLDVGRVLSETDKLSGAQLSVLEEVPARV